MNTENTHTHREHTENAHREYTENAYRNRHKHTENAQRRHVENTLSENNCLFVTTARICVTTRMNQPKNEIPINVIPMV